MVVAASRRTHQAGSTVPTPAPAPARPQRRGTLPRTTTTATTTTTKPRHFLPRAASFVPPLLQQEPHAGEPYREHVKVIPPSKERVARVIKQAHHKVIVTRESGRVVCLGWLSVICV